MVNTESRKRINKVTNPKELDRCIETGQWEIVQIPLWLLKWMLSEDWDVPSKLNQLDTGENKPPLQIPVWLLKNLLRKDRHVPLTVKQVADLLEVHPKTVHRWNSQGLIRKYSITSQGTPKFLIKDVVDALVNKPRLQQLFNRK